MLNYQRIVQIKDMAGWESSFILACLCLLFFESFFGVKIVRMLEVIIACPERNVDMQMVFHCGRSVK